MKKLIFYLLILASCNNDYDGFLSKQGFPENTKNTKCSLLRNYPSKLDSVIIRILNDTLNVKVSLDSILVTNPLQYDGVNWVCDSTLLSVQVKFYNQKKTCYWQFLMRKRDLFVMLENELG